MSAQFLQISEVEGLSTASSSGHGIPMETAQGIDEKGLPIAPLTHQDKGHLSGRSSFGGVSDTRDKTVDFVIHPDDRFITHPENFKVVGAFSIDDNPFDGGVVFQDRLATA